MPPNMAVAIRRVQDDKMKRKEQQATGINFKADSSCAALFCLFIQDRFSLQDAILSISYFTTEGVACKFNVEST